MRHPGRSNRPSDFAAPPPVTPPPESEPETPPPAPLVAAATTDDHAELPVNAAADSVTGASRVAPPPAVNLAAIASAGMAAAVGTGPGSHGGPGGEGRGVRRVRPPVVNRTFALGGDTGDFKAVVCFFKPGIFFIADVHDCEPVAVFYTDTFNVPERQFTEGFPGVTSRSTWFMIDYRGSFAVSQDGTYRFRLHSDDGAYLFIDDALVIEDDGKHEPMSRWGNVHLQVGRHRLKLLYAQTIDRMALQLFVRVPGAWTEKLFKSEL